MVKALLVDPWPWWLGGICIGLLVPVMYYFLNTPLGVSTGYGNLAKIIFCHTKLKWLKSSKFERVCNWRLLFIIGMLIGGFCSARFSGGPVFVNEMGRFTELIAWGSIPTAIWFFCGGLLLALGARLANGCTSGHSIHGIANMHFSSLVATFFFLLFGTITVWLIRLLMMGGI